MKIAIFLFSFCAYLFAGIVLTTLIFILESGKKKDCLSLRLGDDEKDMALFAVLWPLSLLVYVAVNVPAVIIKAASLLVPLMRKIKEWSEKDERMEAGE